MRKSLITPVTILIVFDIVYIVNYLRYGLATDVGDVVFTEKGFEMEPIHFGAPDWIALAVCIGIHILVGLLVWKTWR